MCQHYVKKMHRNCMFPGEPYCSRHAPLYVVKKTKVKVKEILDPCCVCLDDIKVSEYSKCGHSLCLGCKLQLDTFICPVCRGPLPSFDGSLGDVRELISKLHKKVKDLDDEINALRYSMTRVFIV